MRRTDLPIAVRNALDMAIIDKEKLIEMIEKDQLHTIVGIGDKYRDVIIEWARRAG